MLLRDICVVHVALIHTSGTDYDAYDGTTRSQRSLSIMESRDRVSNASRGRLLAVYTILSYT